MTAEHHAYAHFTITTSTDTYAVACIACEKEILHATTSDQATQKDVAELAGKLAAMHTCARKAQEKRKDK